MTKWKNRFVYGTVAGLFLLTYHIILTIANFNANYFVNFIFVSAMYVVAMILGIKRYSNENLEGTISYAQSFSHGFYIFFIASFIDNLKNWIDVAFLGKKNNLISSMDDVLQNISSFGQDEYDVAMKSVNSLLSPVPYLIITIFSVTFSALIVAAIIAIFTKKD